MAQSEKFTKYLLDTSNHSAFRALSVYAKALYPKIKLEWRPEPHNNNGSIRLSVKQAAEFLGCSPETARRAFHELQRKGFLRIIEIAQLGNDGQAKGHCYELTELPMPTAKIPSMLFKQWAPDAEFEIVKAQVNNPGGRNGKSKGPTYNVGRPNIPRMLKEPNPNINAMLTPSTSPQNEPNPNIRGMSSLGNLKGKHVVCEKEQLAILQVADCKGLCGLAKAVDGLQVAAQ